MVNSQPFDQRSDFTTAALRATLHLRRIRTLLPSIDDGTPTLSPGIALILAKESKLLHGIVAGRPSIPDPINRAFTRAAAKNGPVVLGGKRGANAHELTFAVSREAVEPFSDCNFEPDLIEKRYCAPHGWARFDIVVPGGDSPTEIATVYDDLVARIRQESATAHPEAGYSDDRSTEIRLFTTEPPGGGASDHWKFDSGGVYFRSSQSNDWTFYEVSAVPLRMLRLFIDKPQKPIFSISELQPALSSDDNYPSAVNGVLSTLRKVLRKIAADCNLPSNDPLPNRRGSGWSFCLPRP
jgi:hypothetical protein